MTGGPPELLTVALARLLRDGRSPLARTGVDFVTATGNLERVATPLAVFRATPDGLRLEALQPGARLDRVRSQTGFAVVPIADCATHPPTAEELAALESLDPERLRDLDFR